MKWILLVSMAYLVYLHYEYIRNKIYRNKIKYVIHVNGIRGKTSTTNAIGEYLRDRGYRVASKTTGTNPIYTDVEGVDHRIKRFGNANIKEQVKIIKRASKEAADILVIECMAINPKLQKICQEKIVMANIGVITNVRYDHVDVMGYTLDEIAESLGQMIPKKGILIIADENYKDYFRILGEKYDTKLLASGPRLEEIAEKAFKSLNILANMTAGETFYDKILQENQLEESRINSSYEFIWQDYMMELTLGNARSIKILNLFEANDPISTLLCLKEVDLDSYDKIYFLYNHRLDRGERAITFAKRFFPMISYDGIYVTGQGPIAIKRCFEKHLGHSVHVYSDESKTAATGNILWVGIGNIKGIERSSI